MKTLIFTLLLTAQTWAGGVRGGGEVIDVNGKLEMRGVLEQATCDMKSGEDMLKSYPGIHKVLSSIARLDWYFAMELEREIRFLDYCMTGPLLSLKIDTRNIPQIPSNYDSTFAGLRWNRRVYLDRTVFLDPRFTDEKQGRFIIHEAMHSYIPMNMDEGERWVAVMSMDSVIYRVYNGQINDRKTLHNNMRGSFVEFPTTVGSLDPFHTQLEFILGDDTQVRNILLQTPDVARLVGGRYQKLAPYVSRQDQWAISRSPEKILESAVINVLINGTAREIEQTLNRTDLKLVSPNALAFDQFEHLPPEIQLQVMEKADFAVIVNQALARIGTTQVSIENLRVMANPKLQEFAGATRTVPAIPILRLDPLPANVDLPPEYKTLARVLILLAENARWVEVKTLITDNTEFYNKVELRGLIQELKAKQTPVRREALYAAETVQRMRAELVVRFMEHLEGQLSSEVYKLVTEMLKWEK